MRVPVFVAVLFLSSCAGEKLAQLPPPGVDFTGQWKLNEADSDDPQRLLHNQNNPAPTAGPGGGDAQGGGGRGGRPGRGGVGGLGLGGLGGPTMPAIGTLSEGLRWPGNDLSIKQAAGIVTITSGGVRRVYRPGSDATHHHLKSTEDQPTGGRDGPTRSRGEGPPPVCGWDDRTLVVEVSDLDDDDRHFEERYSVSDDRRRLVELISFRGGRSNGFTLSRVWDRVAAVPAPSAGPPPGGSVAQPPPGP